MGVEPANYTKEEQYQQMEADDIDRTDSEVVFHIRKALKSASTVFNFRFP